jgi:peptidoglycan/xylan/chitin deacetylase (PgdA/CDA1 family)
MFFVITLFLALGSGNSCDREPLRPESPAVAGGLTQNTTTTPSIQSGELELIGKIERKIAIEPAFVLRSVKCIWKDDRRAAYTISFDDTRASHYEISGPELSKRGMIGTFSLNTRNVVNWSDWRGLAQAGHEIASHGYMHLMSTLVTEADLRADLRKAKQDIAKNIPQAARVPSFTYPYGLFNDTTKAVVRELHVSARAGWGINTNDLSAEELLNVKGVGVYPPYDLAAIQGTVEEAIRKQAWVLVYFHSVSAAGISDATTIPLDKYLQHLDYIKSLSDSFWIATQGQVADYIRLRRQAAVQMQLKSRTTIELTLTNAPADIPPGTRLSVRIDLPQAWRNRDVLVFDSLTGTSYTVRAALPYLRVELPVDGRIELTGVNG